MHAVVDGCWLFVYPWLVVGVLAMFVQFLRAIDVCSGRRNGFSLGISTLPRASVSFISAACCTPVGIPTSPLFCRWVRCVLHWHAVRCFASACYASYTLCVVRRCVSRFPLRITECLQAQDRLGCFVRTVRCVTRVTTHIMHIMLGLFFPYVRSFAA
jgi:hypothetical protein